MDDDTISLEDEQFEERCLLQEVVEEALLAQANPSTTVVFSHAQANPSTSVGFSHAQANPRTSLGFSLAQANPSTSVGFSHAQANPSTSVGFSNAQANPSTSLGFSHAQANPSTSVGFSHVGGAAQVGTSQVGEAQVGTSQVGETQVGTSQVGEAQAGTSQVGAAQVSAAQVSAAEVRAAQARAAEVRAAQVRAMQGAMQVGAGASMLQEADWDDYNIFNWMSDASNTTLGYIPDPFVFPWSGNQDSASGHPPSFSVHDTPVVCFVPGLSVCEMIKNSSEVTQGPVVVGPDEEPIFLVGRGTPPRYPKTLVLPARVEVNRIAAFVSIDGTEYNIPYFEVLMVQRGQISWVTCYGGDVPVNAIPVGREGMEPVYVARVFREGRYWPGMVSSDDYAALVSINGVEKIFNQYEVLVLLPNA